jgi:hypothetical protein
VTYAEQGETYFDDCVLTGSIPFADAGTSGHVTCVFSSVPLTARSWFTLDGSEHKQAAFTLIPQRRMALPGVCAVNQFCDAAPLATPEGSAMATPMERRTGTASSTPNESPDFVSCSGSGGCLLGDADLRLANVECGNTIGAVVWRADAATLTVD